MNIYAFIQTYWQLYYALLFGLLLAVCYGWYLFGTTAPARVAPAHPRRHVSRRSWYASHRFFSWRLGTIAIAGRFDTGQRELVASIIVKLI